MTPKNRMQIMQPVFGLTSGVILTITEVAEKLGLDYEKNQEAITKLIEHFCEQRIFAEVFPNCFVTETHAGGNPFLLVYTNVHENIYISNIPALQPRPFEDLAQDPEFKGYYRDEEWPNELKDYLDNQNASPSMRIPYGTSVPVNGQHEQAGYLYTEHSIWIVDSEFNVIRRKLNVTDLFDGTLKSFLALFKTQNEALAYASHYTNPDNSPKKAYSGPRRKVNVHSNREARDVIDRGPRAGSHSEGIADASFEEVEKQPGDQKKFSLNDINQFWERFEGFDNSPYAQELKQHFMDNVLAKMI